MNKNKKLSVRCTIDRGNIRCNRVGRRRGGVTACIAVAREVVAAKRTYCPHYLGGIGLVASAHLLAACNGGWLEVDSNTNPLRNDFCGAVTVIRDGEIMLPELPGLGIAPDIAAIAMYRTL